MGKYIVILIFVGVFWYFIYPQFNGNVADLLSTNISINAEADFSVSTKEGFTWKFNKTKDLNETVVFLEKSSYKIGKLKLPGFVYMSESDYNKLLQTKNDAAKAASLTYKSKKTFIIISEYAAIDRIIHTYKKGTKINVTGNYLNYSVFNPEAKYINKDLPMGSEFIFVSDMWLNQN